MAVAGRDRQAWPPPPARPTLTSRQVHVWRVSLPPVAPSLATLEGALSAEERARALSFRSRGQRAEFVAGRGVARQVLAGYLGVELRHVRFGHGRNGKPSLDMDGRGRALRFNISHSSGVVLVAVGRGREVGVDVEQVRAGLDEDMLAERFFSPAEIAALKALGPRARRVAFFACWMRKEAYLKATGEGLLHPLSAFSVSVTPGEDQPFLDVAGERAEAVRWSLRNIEVGEGLAAAVAVEGSDWARERWSWRSR